MLIREPKSRRSGLEATTLVFPHSEKCTINIGIEAIIGTGNLYLHRISKMSSRNPRRVAITNEMIEERDTESCKPESGVVVGNIHWEANLVMRELIDSEAVHQFLLVVEPIDENVGKGERDKEG